MMVSLTKRVTGMVSGVVFLCFVALAGMIYTESREAVRAAVAEQQLVLARKTMEQIDQFLYERYMDISVMSHSVQAREILGKGEIGGAGGNWIGRSLVTDGSWELISLINNEGLVVETTHPEEKGERMENDPQDYEIFNRARQGLTVFSEAIVSEETGDLTMIFAAPVWGDGQEDTDQVGVILGQISWPVVEELLATNQTQAVLIDSQGVVIAQNREYESADLVGKNLRETEQVKHVLDEGLEHTHLVESLFGEVKTMTTHVGESGYLDYTGNNWALIFEIPEEIVFADVVDQSRQVLLWVAPVLILGAWVVVWLISRLVVKPILKLNEAGSRLAEGDFSQRVKIGSRDEIGMLGTTFNQMAQQLGESQADLARRVEEKTKELQEKLAEIGKTNLSLEENKKAMINLLEDAKALEEALKAEKEGVEKKVTERTQQLSDEQAKLVAAISTLPQAVIIIDKNGDLVEQNGRLGEIFGDQTEVWNLNLVDRLLGNDFKLKDKIGEVLREKKVIEAAELQLEAKFIQVFMAPVLNKEKDLIGAIVTIKDITEAKVLARSKDEFFSIASHELRTPLTAIRGNTSMILEYYQEILKDENLKQIVTDTHNASVRLIEIVNDFLDMSRLEMGKIAFKLAPIELPALITETLKEYQVTGSRQKLALEFVPPVAAIPLAMADRDRLRQVLINLIGNGIKFTAEGGVYVGLRTAGDKVIIEVRDTGCGIALANQGLLFHKFQQAGNSLATRDASKGTGLGLYISRLIVEGMGGSLVLVKSEEGKGSTFAIGLPKAV